MDPNYNYNPSAARPPQQHPHHHHHHHQQPPVPPPQQPTSKKQLQIQGPRPTALKLNQESHKIKKPPLHPVRQQPIIIYAVSPKVIHTEASDFMNVVQRLTGLSSSNFSNDGSVSPAARLAATERLASPRELSRPTAPTASSTANFSNDDGGGGGDDIMAMVERLDVGQLPGILSPAPAMLPPVAPGFFSPMSDPNAMSLWNEMSPFMNSFLSSPSASGLFSGPIVSPLRSPDFFNLMMDWNG